MSGATAVSSRIVDEARHVRRMALAALPRCGEAGVFALRSALVRDEDAEVRARAALLLRGADREALAAHRDAVEDALADALRDASPLVRDAAARATGSLRATRAAPALAAAVRSDPAWQVRRSAVRALAAVLDERAAGSLFEALSDPFWRVRHAAVQALAARPSVPLPARPADARAAAALEYIESIRRGETDAGETAAGETTAGEAAYPPEPAVVLPDPPIDVREAPGPGVAAALRDEDPAVVAARLGAAPPDTADGPMLVAALASPHDALRRAAIRVLAARADAGELLRALSWLDDPRVPYAGDAARKLLRHVDARPLCARVLAAPDPTKGALAWALDAASRDVARSVPGALPEALHAAAERAVSHPDPAVRRAAVRAFAALGEDASITAALADPDEATAAEAVAALGPVLSEPAIRDALHAALPRPAPGAPSDRGPFVARALLGAVRMWLGRDLDDATSTWIDAALAAATALPWADVRAEAIALRAHRGTLSAEERARFLADPDPWLREAAMDAEHGNRALAEDPDPFVRRAAARAALGPGAAPERRHAAAALGATSADAWIRARAAGALDARSGAGLAALLCLTRDATPMVRAAAADALARAPAATSACIQLVQFPETPEEVRLAAHGHLASAPSAEALAALEADIASPLLSPATRATLRAVRFVYPASLVASSALAPEPETPSTRTSPARPAGAATSSDGTSPSPASAPAGRPATPLRTLRPLGNTGLAVAPLGISGAGELPPACYEEARSAGVDLFFWEPVHRSLTAFAARAARRHDLVFVTGSYEADRRSIERDVDRALTRLRIEAVGVMLLFWVRSRARLSEGAFDTLSRLKEQGKVRAIGFSTHLRDLATQAITEQPWDVVMCRLSAAHPGAETSLLPAAAARSTGILAFSALSYGRLLDPHGTPPITAADCYRYALSQPAVSACLSAPRRYRELTENLAVLERPTLAAPDIARLRAHGARVHARNRAFSTLVHRA